MSRFFFCKNAAFQLLSGHNKNIIPPPALVILKHNTFSSTSTVILDPDITSSPKSSTISYLITTWGLPSKQVHTISPKLSKPDSEQNAVSILRTLKKDYDFTNDHIAMAFAKLPRLLLLNSETIIKPKLGFLRSSGFTDSEIHEIVSKTPQFFNHSLGKKIIPSLNYLKTIGASRKMIVHLLRHNHNLFMPKHYPNIDVLRSHGVSEDQIMKMFQLYPRSLAQNPTNFADACAKAIELGIDPKKSIFPNAVSVISYITTATWERKIKLYRSLGWSDDEVLSMFKRRPNFVVLSDKLIKNKTSFFKSKLQWDSNFLAANPKIIFMSIQKRIIPRCSVLNLLGKMGLLKKNMNTRSVNYLSISEKVFTSRYLNKFEKQVPEVLEAYQGKITFNGWS